MLPCRKGIDVGPVCSSVLVKLCAQRRDLPMAMDIFYRLSGHSTLNRQGARQRRGGGQHVRKEGACVRTAVRINLTVCALSPLAAPSH